MARDMSRWLGDGGMPIIEAIGGRFDAFGPDEGGWATAVWEPTPLACNPHGFVQAGVHSILLDAAINFAINSGLPGKDRTRATLEMKCEYLRQARQAERYTLRGEVVRVARQVAWAESRITDADGELVSKCTATFLLQRAEES
jgi:uncharacterized protein (TIGR00369 family)